MNREKAVRLAFKLKALADDKAAAPGEKSTARAKQRKLQADHGIRDSELASLDERRPRGEPKRRSGPAWRGRGWRPPPPPPVEEPTNFVVDSDGNGVTWEGPLTTDAVQYAINMMFGQHRHVYVRRSTNTGAANQFNRPTGE